MFWLPDSKYAWNEKPDTGSPQETVVQTRSIKQKEPLILVSQDCDILSRDEPRVEALLVRVKDKPRDRGYLARIVSNSYREFVLDFERGLVADARVRVQISKEVLRGINPDPWIMDLEMQDSFIDWLAGRYDRPPIPTAVYEALCRPVRSLIERLRDEEPDIFAALNRAVRQIRVRLPTTISDELDLGLFLILNDDVDYEGSDAVIEIRRRIEMQVAQGEMICNLDVEVAPYSEVLLAEYDATRPIDLDYMTEQGDEVNLSETGFKGSQSG